MQNISKIPALDLSCLTVAYNDTIVLADCSLTIPQGIILGIMGPNGAGKTTFIKSILGLIPKTKGHVLFLNKTLGYVRQKIAYIPQRSSVDWDFPLTVADMVLMGCYRKLGWIKRPGTSEQIQMYEALCAVGMQDYAHKPIGTLSGGQQQRAFIARGLMQDADIYFLDEPFAGIDAPTEKMIVALFKTLRDQGKTIFVVHHDIMTAPVYFDWGLLLNKKIIAYGSIDEVLTQRNFIQLYGENFSLDFMLKFPLL